ncbi:hypothetical protein HHL16_05775 [Pseudoflavitalea sp. G-6-1-2]|uniref:hypothetical protein n=1 Tax=Pseudoflavitalea sp. G-6-1-2 TaxID=2728841 RepID=UPI00146A95C1|nr:hypothetical protein [Pseudoflavitalea sp. G-6-1-2]NML20371.1 hypothetical protein [Pseudoflavitalea sp. G-6-1-2]
MKVRNYTTGIPGRKVVVAALCLLVTGSVQAQQENNTKNNNKGGSGGAHIGFIYPVSTHGNQAGKSTNSFSFHVLGGLSLNETGFTLSGLGSVIKGNASGAQFAGLLNNVQGQASGAQLAGLYNYAKYNSGAQLAGLFNSTQKSSGTQIAGFGNFSKGDSANAGDLQLSGFLNLHQNVTAQIGGFANKATNAEFQMAGFLNKGKDVNVQVAGFLNIAKKVKGVQVGFINIADSNANPVGIINIVKGGEMGIRVSVDELGTPMLSFTSGGKNLYGALGVGFNSKTKNTMYALEGVIGMHFDVSEFFRLHGEVVTTVLDDFKKGDFHRNSIRFFPAFRIGNQLEVFAGPSINFVSYDIASGKGDALVEHVFWSEKRNNGRFHGMYIGATGGISWKLK